MPDPHYSVFKRPLQIAAALATAAGLLLVLQACTGDSLGPDHGNDPLSVSPGELTQAPARIVWCRDIGTMKDVYALENRLELVGFDTEDGRGARIIVPGPRNISRPVISPDGNYVFFSDREDNFVYRVDWNGEHLVRFARGRALETWQNPETGRHWVLIGDAQAEHPRLHSAVSRHRVHNANISETVCDDFVINENNFQLSKSGRFASADVKDTGNGIIDLEKSVFHKKGGGCWPSIAPDDSRRFWRMSHGHRELIMHGPEGNHKMDLSCAPGIDGHEVFHPRWSNHPRFLVISGPYKEGIGFTRVRNGGPGVEIYLGKLSPDYKKIESWCRVTADEYADFYPDAWIGRTTPCSTSPAR